jgi:hypothetical protein
MVVSGLVSRLPPGSLSVVLEKNRIGELAGLAGLAGLAFPFPCFFRFLLSASENDDRNSSVLVRRVL